MVARHEEEVIQKHKRATLSAAPKIVNGISGHLGRHVPRHVVVGPNNARVPFSSTRSVAEHHALELGQNHTVATPKLVQVSWVIQKLFCLVVNFKMVYNMLLFS